MADDLASIVQRARDDLADVTWMIGELWRHLYDPDWEPEHGRHTGQHRWRPLWTERGPVQQVYLDVVAELARAHWVLGQGTSVPVHWTRRPDTSDRAPTVPHSEALAWTRVLDGMLAWCAEHAAPVEAVQEAAAHVASARGAARELWPEREQPSRCARAGCEGEDGRPRPLGARDGKVCSACRQRDRRARKAS